MIFVFCVISLISMALCSDLPGGNISEIAGYLLDVQRPSIYFEIYDIVGECNQTHPAAGEDLIRMFQKNYSPTKSSKCLMDCVLRTIDVVTNNGFHEKEYIIIVKKLLSNYTKIPVETEDRKSYDLAVVNARSRYDYIQLFERAAHKCKKDVKFEGSDNCEKTFRIAKCIADSATYNSGGKVQSGLFPPMRFPSDDPLFTPIPIEIPETAPKPPNNGKITAKNYQQCFLNPVSCYR